MMMNNEVYNSVGWLWMIYSKLPHFLVRIVPVKKTAQKNISTYIQHRQHNGIDILGNAP